MKILPSSANRNPLKMLTNSVVSYYEECLGLSDVHRARDEVNQCEENLYQAQEARREKQAEIKILQNRLKDIHSELDRTPRGEDKYLYLITEEHSTIKRERELMSTYEELENRERDAFNKLSSRVRVSHEREREREERTKYWSLTGSLIGALLGIAGTTIATELRMHHIREMIPTEQKIQPVLNEMVQIVRGSQGQVSTFLDDLKQLLKLEGPFATTLKESESLRLNSELDVQKTMATLKEQNSTLLDQMNEMKQLIRRNKAVVFENGSSPNGDEKGDRSIVYMGDSMEAVLMQTEKNLESKMKLQALAIVVGSYALLAITIPLVYFFYVNR